MLKYRYSCTISLTLTLDRDGLSTPRPGHFPSPVTIAEEVGWAPGPIRTCSNSLAPGSNPRTVQSKRLSIYLYKLLLQQQTFFWNLSYSFMNHSYSNNNKVMANVIGRLGR